jgi:hypothetical protein
MARISNRSPIYCVRRMIRTKRDQKLPCQPAGDRNIYLNQLCRRRPTAYPAYLDVISKVVPKICARTNSAMATREVDKMLVISGSQDKGMCSGVKRGIVRVGN